MGSVSDNKTNASRIEPRVQSAAKAFLTVTEITSRIREAIVKSLPSTVHVVGQISNLKRHSSGHLYLTLKDDNAELACVMWRSATRSLPFEIEDGMEVIATGSIDVYQRSGRYQLMARRFEPRGIGALELAFRQLRDRLAAEGLFDSRDKKPLPSFPERIALITSPTGAVVRDMIATLHRRYRPADVLVMPVRVQGAEAAGEIARAVAALNRWSSRLGGIDVMIVGRGGGSIEDLWAFNEEIVARSIYRSEIPVVSAVGHETDVTICDLVADVRAPTPTAAAELVVPDAEDVRATVRSFGARLLRAAGHRVELAQAAVASVCRRPWWREPLIAIRRREQAIDEVMSRLLRHAWLHLRESEQRLTRAESLVQRIQPSAFAARRASDLTEAAHRLHRAVDGRLRDAERRLATIDRAVRMANPIHRVKRARMGLDGAQRRLRLGVAQRGKQCRERLGGLESRLSAPSVGRARNGLDELQRRLRLAMAQRGGHWRERLSTTESRLQALSYKGVLRRGFSITRLKVGRQVVRNVADLVDTQILTTELFDGEVDSRVINRRQLELFETDG